MKKTKRHLLNAHNMLCDDKSAGVPHREPISSYFKNSRVNEEIRVLNFRNNRFGDPKTLEAISLLIKEKFPNTKMVDLRRNFFGRSSWAPLKALINKQIFVNINSNLFLLSPDAEEQISSFTEAELEKLIWIPKSIRELKYGNWRDFVRDKEKIDLVIRTHWNYYNLSEQKKFKFPSNLIQLHSHRKIRSSRELKKFPRD